jgi:hypothetical protein
VIGLQSNVNQSSSPGRILTAAEWLKLWSAFGKVLSERCFQKGAFKKMPSAFESWQKTTIVIDILKKPHLHLTQSVLGNLKNQPSTPARWLMAKFGSTRKGKNAQ